MIVGIDLGTTNSLVAVVKNGKPEILRDGDSALIPSVVAYDSHGHVQAVGGRARTLKSLDPDRVLYSVKRLIGKGRADLTQVARDLPFDFAPSTEEIIRIQVGSRSITPIEVSADVLRRCKFVAENELGCKIEKAVVTVPAYFNDSQRVATSVAGRLAGLEVVRIINEPTAAALAFGMGKNSDSQVVAVYDFGGGTFDISILKVVDGVFEVLATDGDTDLGGDDLDRLIAEWLLKQIGDEPKSREDKTIFVSQVEQLKRSLSDSEVVEVTLHWGDKIRWAGSVSRSEINAAMRPVVDKTLELCRRCLRAAGITTKEINEVVMVGGSTRVPFVIEEVGALFGRKPNTSVNPDHVVALGAAVQASILEGVTSDALLLDVVPLSLGLETMGGVVSRVIPRNTTIPCRATEAFTTYQDNQTGVDFHIVQGERELVSACRSLGRFKLRVPPQPAGIPKILVHFVLDANGVLHVKAVNEKTNEVAQMDVRPSFGLSEKDVESLLRDARDNAAKDVDFRRLVEARNQAGALIRATRKSLSSALLEFEFKIAQEEKLLPVVQALEEDCRGSNVDVIRARTKELDFLTRDLAETVLNSAVQQRLKSQSLESAS